MSGQASSKLNHHLSRHLAKNGLLPADADEQALLTALTDMSQRLRVARGEYDGVP